MDPNSGSQFSYSGDQEAPKFIIQNGDGLLDGTGTLPDTYGDNRLVVMPRDPLWFFAYWDVTPDRLDAMRDQVGQEMWQKGQAILRVYDVTGIEGEGVGSVPFFDVPVEFAPRRWYVNVPQPGRTYVAELGFTFPDGRFLALLRSNRSTHPSGTVSNQTDSRWMIVNMQVWEKMFETPDRLTGAGGSAEVAKMMAQRWEFLRSVYSGSSSRLSSPTAPISTDAEHKP